MASKTVMGHIGTLYQKSFPIVILLPSLIIGGVVLVYPLINGVLLSFTNYTTYIPQYNWIGVKNFVMLFRDPVYWEVLFNSFFIIFLLSLLKFLTFTTFIIGGLYSFNSMITSGSILNCPTLLSL